MERREYLKMLTMVTYPDLSNLSDSAGIGELLALPNASYPFYWALIMIGIFVIVSLSMYFREKSLGRPGNLLSSMAVSAFAMIMLSTVGTLFNILTLEIFLPLLVGFLLIIAIWIFSGPSN